MIQYETAPSPFFEANKKYCETIENNLKTMKADCSGWCKSYGYEILATINKNSLIYDLKFDKHQTTENGV
jgi:hypothetical protein